VVERARIVLLAADGLTGPQIAGRAGCTEPTVVKWRRRPRIWPARRIIEAILYWTGPGAPGGTCPPTSRLGRPSTATSPPGAMTAPWPGCTASCATRPGLPPGARRRLRPR
jgi:hypothetical protein